MDTTSDSIFYSNRNQIVFTIFRLILNKIKRNSTVWFKINRKNCRYNLILVYLSRIKRRFLCVRRIKIVLVPIAILINGHISCGSIIAKNRASYPLQNTCLNVCQFTNIAIATLNLSFQRDSVCVFFFYNHKCCDKFRFFFQYRTRNFLLGKDKFPNCKFVSRAHREFFSKSY